MVKSIFDLERRINFEKEFERIMDSLLQNTFVVRLHRNNIAGNFFEIADYCFKNWPYRLTAMNTRNYFQDIDIDIDSYNYISSTKKLYVLQFIINFIGYLDLCSYISGVIGEPYHSICDNIRYILESMNYKIELDDKNRYFFTKKDTDVDSVLKVLENEQDLRLTLLEYNDFRIENDSEEKAIILFKIYKYIELNREFYKNDKLYSNIGLIVNKFGVRHNDPKQIIVEEQDKISIYDLCFKMMIHLIRQVDINTGFTVLKDKYIK